MLKNLNKKDSLKVLLEEYESTLHKADGVHESPSKNSLATLLKPEDCNADLFSIRAEDKKSQLEKKLSKENNKDVPVDRNILAMTTKIRAQQNWVHKGGADADGFNVDDEDMLQQQLTQGVRKLSQNEKILMFGLVDKQMQENVNAMKKMIGISTDSSPRRKPVAKGSTQKGTWRKGGAATLTVAGVPKLSKQGSSQRHIAAERTTSARNVIPVDAVDN